MANPNEGDITCPLCQAEANIRRAGKGTRKWYIHCESCGNIQPNGTTGQEYIRAHGKIYGAAAPTNAPPEKREPADKPPASDAAARAQAPAAGESKPKKKKAPVQPDEAPKPTTEEKPARAGFGFFR